jgi:hypothetical protein
VLVTWYSIPARIAAVVMRRLVPVLRRFPVLKGLVIAFWVMVAAGLILHGLVFGFALTHFLLFSPLAASIVLGLTGQTAERYADRQAAELGFGDELLQVFYGWQAQAARDGAAFKRARVTSSDPTIATRLKALEKHLGIGRGPGQFGRYRAVSDTRRTATPGATGQAGLSGSGGRSSGRRSARTRMKRMPWRTWPACVAASALTSATTIGVTLTSGLLLSRPRQRCELISSGQGWPFLAGSSTAANCWD